MLYCHQIKNKNKNKKQLFPQSNKLNQNSNAIKNKNQKKGDS